MSWLQRVFSLMNSSSLQPEIAVNGSYVASLTTSLSSQSNSASPFSRISPRKLDTPSVPLEYRGINGEYDPQGLAKRIAQAFDQHPQVQQIKTLCIIQHGSKISLLGKVVDDAQLQQVIDVAKQVDGIQEIDVQQVVVERQLAVVEH